MKISFQSVITFLILLFMFHGCTSDKSTNPVVEDNPVYYPGTEGSFYKYEIVQQTSKGFAQNGFRIVHFGGDITLDRKSYKTQIDSIIAANETSTSISYFRITDTGVFTFVDTTGLYNNFPDSLQSSIDLQTEMRLFLFPLSAGSSWPVYKVSIYINELIVYDLLDISGRYISDETIALNLLSGAQSLNTKKIKYELNIQDDTSGSVTTYTAFAWLAQDIGVVKMEGDGLVLSLFSGGLQLSGISETVMQTLVDYDVK